MRTLLVWMLLAGVALAQDIPVTDQWDVDLLDAQAHDIKIFRGETRYLQPRYLTNGVAANLTGVTTVQLWYKPTSVATATWMYVTNGVVTNASAGRVHVTWSTNAEAIYSEYNYNIYANTASGASLAARGKLTLAGTVAGTSTNAPGMVVLVETPGTILRFPTNGWTQGNILDSVNGGTTTYSRANTVTATATNFAIAGGVLTTNSANVITLTSNAVQTAAAILTNGLDTVASVDAKTNAVYVLSTNAAYVAAKLLTNGLDTVASVDTKTNAVYVLSTNAAYVAAKLLTNGLDTVASVDTKTNAVYVLSTNAAYVAAKLLTNGLDTVASVDTKTNAVYVLSTNAAYVAAKLLTNGLDTVASVDAKTNAVYVLSTNAAYVAAKPLTNGLDTVTAREVAVAAATQDLATVTALNTATSTLDAAKMNAFTSSWKIVYSDSTTSKVELALGAPNSYLKSSGLSAAPSWSAITASATNVRPEDLVGTMSNGYMLVGNGTDLILREASFVRTNLSLVPGTDVQAYHTNLLMFTTNLLGYILWIDGAGSGIDADKLDGFESADLFNTSTNMFTGSGTTGRLSSAAGDAGKYLRADATWVDVMTLVTNAVNTGTNAAYADAKLLTNGLDTVASVDAKTNAVYILSTNAAYVAAKLLTNGLATVTYVDAATQTIAGASVLGTVPAATWALTSATSTTLVSGASVNGLNNSGAITNLSRVVQTNEAVVFLRTATDNIGMEGDSWPISGQQNSVWLGVMAAYASTGQWNTAIGYSALNQTLGSYNTAIGRYTLNLSPGSYNTAVGNECMDESPGSFNMALGYLALQTSAGSYNTALGANCLNQSPGSYNVSGGTYSLSEAPGSNNVAFGFGAGQMVGGTSNVFIGSAAGYVGEKTNYINTTVIGAGVLSKGNNTTVIGLPTSAVSIDGSLTVLGGGNVVTNNGSATLSLAAGTTVADAIETNQPVTLHQLRDAMVGNKVLWFTTNLITDATYTNTGGIATGTTYQLVGTVAELPPQATRSVPSVAVGSYYSANVFTGATYTVFAGQDMSVEIYMSENSGGSSYVKAEAYRVEPSTSNWIEWGEAAASNLVPAGAVPTSVKWSIPVGSIATNVPFNIGVRLKRSGGTLSPGLIVGVGTNYPSSVSITLPSSVFTADLTPLTTFNAHTQATGNAAHPQMLTNNHASASLSGTTTLTNLVVNGAQTNKGTFTVLGGGNVVTQDWQLAHFVYQGDGPVNGLSLLGSNYGINAIGVTSTDNTDFGGGGRYETPPMPAGVTQQVWRAKLHTRQDVTTNQVGFRPYHQFFEDGTSTRIDSAGDTYQVTIPFTNAGSVWVTWTNTWGTMSQVVNGGPFITTLYRMQSSATGTVQISAVQYRNVMP